MIRRIVRLTFRINRFEVSAIVVLGGFLVVSSVVISWILGNLAMPPECRADFQSDQATASCASKFDAFQKVVAIATPVALLMSLFPFIGGLLIGGPVIAREIESGTTSLAWSMSPSRLRWFLHRVAPMVVLLLVASFLVGVAADIMIGRLVPESNLPESFVSFRFRGVLIATQAFVVASTAVAVGALIGRAVPTFLLSLILGTLVIVAVGLIHREVLLAEAVVVAQDQNFEFSNDSLTLDFKFQMSDGRLATYEEMITIDPTAFDTEFGEPKYPMVSLLIPGQRYRAVEGREAVTELGIGLAFLAAGAVVITRRRPT